MRTVRCSLVSNFGKYLSSDVFSKSYYGMYGDFKFVNPNESNSLFVTVMYRNGHSYQICLSPSARSSLRSFSSKISVLRISTSALVRCSSKDGDSVDKGDAKSSAESSGGSDTSPGKGGGKGKDGGSNHLSCPKCGDPCTHVETFVCKYTCSVIILSFRVLSSTSFFQLQLDLWSVKNVTTSSSFYPNLILKKQWKNNPGMTTGILPLESHHLLQKRYSLD